MNGLALFTSAPSYLGVSLHSTHSISSPTTNFFQPQTFRAHTQPSFLAKNHPDQSTRGACFGSPQSYKFIGMSLAISISPALYQSDRDLVRDSVLNSHSFTSTCSTGTIILHQQKPLNSFDYTVVCPEIFFSSCGFFRPVVVRVASFAYDLIPLKHPWVRSS